MEKWILLHSDADAKTMLQMGLQLRAYCVAGKFGRWWQVIEQELIITRWEPMEAVVVKREEKDRNYRRFPEDKGK